MAAQGIPYPPYCLFLPVLRRTVGYGAKPGNGRAVGMNVVGNGAGPLRTVRSADSRNPEVSGTLSQIMDLNIRGEPAPQRRSDRLIAIRDTVLRLILQGNDVPRTGDRHFLTIKELDELTLFEGKLSGRAAGRCSMGEDVFEYRKKQSLFLVRLTIFQLVLKATLFPRRI